MANRSLYFTTFVSVNLCRCHNSTLRQWNSARSFFFYSISASWFHEEESTAHTKSSEHKMRDTWQMSLSLQNFLFLVYYLLWRELNANLITAHVHSVAAWSGRLMELINARRRTHIHTATQSHNLCFISESLAQYLLFGPFIFRNKFEHGYHVCALGQSATSDFQPLVALIEIREEDAKRKIEHREETSCLSSDTRTHERLHIAKSAATTATKRISFLAAHETA